jgi:uncharacterized membrane protein YsdA (DUF1294 family)
LLPFAISTINVITFARFWWDKEPAKAGNRRIPEADLLGWALIGGTPGAFLARSLFRHKTRKQPFVFHLQLIAAFQVGAAAGLAYAFTG